MWKSNGIKPLAITISIATLLFFTSFISFNKNYADKQSFKVVVKYKSEAPAEGIKVNYDVCGGVSCIGGGKNVYTDKNGEAVIEWASGCKVCYVYIKGIAYEGDYRDGEVYYFKI